jgi:hypothetical protein
MIAISRRLEKHCSLSLQPSTCIPSTVLRRNFYSMGKCFWQIFPGLSIFQKYAYVGNNVSWYVHLWKTWQGNNVSWFVHLWKTMTPLLGNNDSAIVFLSLPLAALILVFPPNIFTTFRKGKRIIIPPVMFLRLFHLSRKLHDRDFV